MAQNWQVWQSFLVSEGVGLPQGPRAPDQSRTALLSRFSLG